MAAKKKAAKAGGGAVAAGKAVRSNEYVQRLIEDEDLRENLRTAFDSSKKAYSRINGKGPAKAIMDDKKTQKELKEAAYSLREAADTLRGARRKRKTKRRGGLLTLLLVGGVAAVVVNEGLRKKVLDALFGAEEEFEYTSTTTPQTSNPPAAPAGTS
jgi:adenylosuccinate synthase